MIKISRLADYAIIILGALSVPDKELMTATYISKETKLPEPTVGKVLKMLARGNLLVSVRGVRGGYKIASPASEISLSDVITVMDGPVALTFCAEGDDDKCEYFESCPVKYGWGSVNKAVATALENVSLQDMIDSG